MDLLYYKCATSPVSVLSYIQLQEKQNFFLPTHFAADALTFFFNQPGPEHLQPEQRAKRLRDNTYKINNLKINCKNKYEDWFMKNDEQPVPGPDSLRAVTSEQRVELKLLQRGEEKKKNPNQAKTFSMEKYWTIKKG